VYIQCIYLTSDNKILVNTFITREKESRGGRDKLNLINDQINFFEFDYIKNVIPTIVGFSSRDNYLFIYM